MSIWKLERGDRRISRHEAASSKQGFSTIYSVIPAFCSVGDIIVADPQSQLCIQKEFLTRDCTMYYDHNDLRSLEKVLRGH